MAERTSLKYLPRPAHPSQLRALTVQGHRAIPTPSPLLPPPAPSSWDGQKLAGQLGLEGGRRVTGKGRNGEEAQFSLLPAGSG